MIKIYNEDCLPAMKKMQDNQFDLAIVDPPYGKKPHSNFGVKETVKFSKEDVKWDIKPISKYFDELFRISKNQIIWGMNYFIENLKSTDCIIIWDKENGNNPFADFELAWASFSSGAKIYRKFWLGSHIHRFEDIIHPTQKPVSLYEWLLKNYAKEGDTILDTHLGSGSIAIACHNYGFDLVGYEIDKDYYEGAVKRLEDRQNQQDLTLTSP